MPLTALKKAHPTIHCITNYVTANPCANILLACGGSAIMSDDPLEAEEVTSLTSGLCLNLGTFSERKLSAMLIAGKKANLLSHPIVLDPVGVGASSVRTEAAKKLLRKLDISAVRGNISEIKCLFGGGGRPMGVESGEEDELSEDELIKFAAESAKKAGCTVLITGKTDAVSDGETTALIYNGTPLMKRITGAGCMLSALTATFLAANPESRFYAAVSAVAAMGVAGEIAKERMTPLDGNASFCNYLIDAIFNLDENILSERSKVKITKAEARK